MENPLIRQVNDLVVPPGALALWGLGQSGFVFKGGNTIAYIDPYLSNSVDDAGSFPNHFMARAFPPPVLPEEATNAQVVFCTHEHGDHTDDKTIPGIAQASPNAIYIGPSNSRDIIVGLGISESCVIVPEAEKPQRIGDITFTAIPAAHYGLDYDPARGYRWLGFIIELNGVTFYHSGDTILYDGLVDKLKGYSIDIATMPINGRDWWREQRNLIGNLEPREAAELVTLLGIDTFIPNHNDMFVANRLNPSVLAEAFDRIAPRQKYHWLQPGELYYYVKR